MKCHGSLGLYRKLREGRALIQNMSFFAGCNAVHASGFDGRAISRSQGHEFEILAKPVHPQDLLARLRVKGAGSSSGLFVPCLAASSGRRRCVFP